MYRLIFSPHIWILRNYSVNTHMFRLPRLVYLAGASGTVPPVWIPSRYVKSDTIVSCASWTSRIFVYCIVELVLIFFLRFAGVHCEKKPEKISKNCRNGSRNEKMKCHYWNLKKIRRKLIGWQAERIWRIFIVNGGWIWGYTVAIILYSMVGSYIGDVQYWNVLFDELLGC